MKNNETASAKALNEWKAWEFKIELHTASNFNGLVELMRLQTKAQNCRQDTLILWSS